MIYKDLILLYFLLTFFACNPAEKTNKPQFETEIKNLKTAEAKKAYLEKIFEDDQKVRGPKGSELMLKYGKDSKEHMDYVKALWAMDKRNLLKVEKYFEIHGYPKKELGDLATSAPSTVIHHAQGYEARERNFEILYQAYLEGELEDGAIAFYLGRMYEMVNGKRLVIKGPFRSEDEINLLIKELDLEQKKANVEKILSHL